MMLPSDEMMLRVRRAFHDYGFRDLSMGGIATACGYTRRNLYNYFSSKEDVFRAAVRHQNADYTARSIAAGRALLEQKASALDVLSTILDEKFGTARRELNRSPHVVELNTEAFRLCHDIMIESAAVFGAELEQVIADLGQARKLRLKCSYTPAHLAQMLADAARGVNQSLPPVPSGELVARYRLMSEAILQGADDKSAQDL